LKASFERVSAGQEIERKFLVTGELPDDLDRYPSEEISQGYVAVADDGTEVRVRARGGDYTLTVKSGPARARVEEEIEIEESRFESLWPLTRRPADREAALPDPGWRPAVDRAPARRRERRAAVVSSSNHRESREGQSACRLSDAPQGAGGLSPSQ
jgi:hypothetical protein